MTPDALPHGPPARFVEEVLERQEGVLVCRARIGEDSPWTHGGAAPATAGLEIAAQAAAWLEALERADAGEADERRVGYLVRVRQASLGAAIPRDAAVLARVRRSGGAPPLAIYEIEVRLEGVDGDDESLVCSATLGTFLTEEAVATDHD